MIQYYCPTCRAEHMETEDKLVTYCQECGDGAIVLIHRSDPNEQPLPIQTQLLLKEQQLQSEFDSALAAMFKAQDDWAEASDKNGPEYDAYLLAKKKYDDTEAAIKKIHKAMNMLDQVEATLKEMAA